MLSHEQDVPNDRKPEPFSKQEIRFPYHHNHNQTYQSPTQNAIKSPEVTEQNGQ